MAAKKRSGGFYSESVRARVDEATRGVTAPRESGTSRWPSPAALEKNVDAILMSRGLALDAPPEQLLDKSRRMQPFPPPPSRRRKKAARRRAVAKKPLRRTRPSRAKKLRGRKRK